MRFQGPPAVETTEEAAPATRVQTSRSHVPANVRLFFALALLLMTLFTGLRLALILSVRAPGDATNAELAHSFLVGLRFDASTVGYLLAPVMLLCYIPWISPWRGPRIRKIYVVAVTLLISVGGFLLVAEFEFFREFQSRFNQLAIRYFDHPATVLGMIWYDYPVIRYLLGALVVAVLLWLVVRLAFRWAGRSGAERRKTRLVNELGGALLVAACVVFAVRGGFQQEPLRWGDAFQGDNEFASQMSLNGLWCLGHAMRDSMDRGDRSGGWDGQLSKADARAVVRRMVVGPKEALADPDGRTVLRQGPTHSSLILKSPSGRPLNVVVVMMESFSGRFCGATGAPRSFTPAFDALAKDGILFDRAFSAGSHTHQGIFATQLGFPNLPGYESLMESGAGNQEFMSLPAIFQNFGYKTFFLYNGNFSWDNMRGFFRKQGVDKFVGGEEMLKDAKFTDPVWGVCDGDLFDRCNVEFEAMHKAGKPFYAAVMTLSNHAPFKVPPIPGEEPTTDMDNYNARLTAMRYADYAVGQFIADAKKLSYFDETLFVFVGDHGFAVKPALTDVNLLYHHVPLLFYAPKLTDRRGVDHRVASHMNVVPSVIGLLGLPETPHAAWARNLFDDQSFADENFAVFKQTGGGKAVALIRGDEMLLLREAKAEPQLMTYTLWPPAVTPVTDPAAEPRKKAMTKELKAYVQAALTDLQDHKAGPKAAGKQ